MSVIQVEDLVSYQLRASYLTEIADGVGERLITLNESYLNSAPFKAAGWRTNPALIKRTHSPPIPTAVASEYFQAPRQAGLTLEDEPEDGGMLGGAGADAVGPSALTKRRRRREQMEEEDSSDLSDESDDEQEQRAAQQIKFAKMPVRNRSGSSPIQSSNLRQVSATASPRLAPPRRGSQSALETVKERVRRDTVTSSEVSSDNELDGATFQRQRDAARAAARSGKLQTKVNSEPASVGISRHDSELLAEEEEDSDASDMSSAFNESIDSASILVVDNPIQNVPTSQQVVGTPPKQFRRTSTIRRSHMPPPTQVVGELPPPRPLSTIRPISMIQPKSLLSAALNAKKTKPAMPFDRFATLSGQGESSPIMLRIYAPFSKTSSKPFEVFIRRKIREDGPGERHVTVADVIGLSLWRYNEEKLEPPLPSDKLNVNWWTLKMVEEGGEVDDDFPPLDRTKPLVQFVTAPSNKEEGPRQQLPIAPSNRMGRGRSNTKVYDDFALVQASEDEFEENKAITPHFDQEATQEEEKDDELTPRNTPQPNLSILAPREPRGNPVINTAWKPDTMFADAPRPQASSTNTTRGEHKLLRIHLHSPDVAPGQLVTLDVTTDMYLEEVLELVCRKRQLDKAQHVLKLPGSGVLVMLDRPVSALGKNITDLDLYRRRFATDGPLMLTGSPSSSSPRPLMFPEAHAQKKSKKAIGSHPLAQEAIAQEELGNTNYKKYVVWRKQPMRFVALNERILVIDGEYVHIMPSSNGKAILEGGGKTSSIHFSTVVGCKVSRRHPTNFKIVFFKNTESKRYDFEAKSADEAAEIVAELKKGISPYRDII
ncbi:Stress-activated map kinase-interacting protein 1 [Pleurostoma richardsiae]|uniref:Stress-activated map kinase-interacting protein 1 n=1 Tax=Pleurostoma richardsiae TaxID=41990 RepID=A0AA38VBC0_9PEZI|nr:Stress-activated map kinase-interacting protein 1 [Pleurostoma richardsiae]